MANLALLSTLPQLGQTSDRDCTERWPLLNSSTNSSDRISSLIGGVTFRGASILPSSFHIVLKDRLMNHGHGFPDLYLLCIQSTVCLSPAFPDPIERPSALKSSLSLIARITASLSLFETSDAAFASRYFS